MDKNDILIAGMIGLISLGFLFLAGYVQHSDQELKEMAIQQGCNVYESTVICSK